MSSPRLLAHPATVGRMTAMVWISVLSVLVARVHRGRRLPKHACEDEKVDETDGEPNQTYLEGQAAELRPQVDRDGEAQERDHDVLEVVALAAVDHVGLDDRQVHE